MEKTLWEVEYTSLPRIRKYCKKCGTKTEFISSELFRVNANQKNLDIWLIYKCSACNTTWKQELFSRVKPGSLAHGMLEKFYQNDHESASHYTMNCSSFSNTGCEVTPPAYTVVGPDLLPSNNPAPEKTYEIHLISAYEFDIKILSILKRKLPLSHRQLEELVASKKLTCTTNSKIKKCRLKKEQSIFLTM